MMNLPKLKMNFYEAKARFNAQENSWDEIKNPIVGKLFWTKPKEILWLFATDNQEAYKGHQTQFGIDITGKIFWAYYSHCSCNDYSDYEGKVNQFKEEDWKLWELDDVSKDVFAIMAERIRKLNKSKRNNPRSVGVVPKREVKS